MPFRPSDLTLARHHSPQPACLVSIADWNSSPCSRHSDSDLDDIDDIAPVARNIPTTDERTGSGSQASDSFDVLSAYDDDDLIPDPIADKSPVLTPGTVIEDPRASDINGHHGQNDGNDDDESTYSDQLDRYQTPPPMLTSKPTPPHLELQTADNSVDHDASHRGVGTESSQSAKFHKPLPKSPGAASPFASFFGWGNQSPSNTEFSSLPSPHTPRKAGANDTHHTTANSSFSHTTKANDATSNPLGYCESYLSTPPPSNYESSAHIEEMEDELKAISSELASSIRREMDLEDLVDRLQEQANNPQGPNKRTSDYFSDSGYSSVKASETDHGREEIEKIQRRSEQEKASLRLELTTKLQDERMKRKELDQQIKNLAERASHVDLAKMNNMDANERVRDLENTCEDLRRRLTEERSVKDNFEDLLSALKGELHDACNERDNLRDEVVPQLRARVEGLETEAAEYANLTYESSKMQQELQTLKQENTTLRRGSVMGNFPVRESRIMSGGLSRSNSVAGGMRSQRPPMGLSRSNSVKAAPGQVESREALAERVKDVEAQRDALHGALKNLLERQEFQNREYQKRIKLLEKERDRLITGPGKRGGFEREILNLRTEINVLRRRAEDALEQKWQVEKGLSGLKMDLDRAEGETASLRALLSEKDILIPETLLRSSGSSTGSDSPVTSESLNDAYQRLQAAYSESLERIKSLESSISSDEETQRAMQRLETALSVAVTERDALKDRYENVSANEFKSVHAERALADELLESAHQVEQLASQVQQQLSANADLRMRLADAVARGDADRKTNNKRITTMMEHLRSLEDQLVSAQTASEDQVTHHEDVISKLRDAHNSHLQRMNGSSSMGGLRSPALQKGSVMDRSGPSNFPGKLRLTAASFEDEAEMKTLRVKVAELEKALADADQEMEEVITRMSTAQVEVLNLQEERDAAVRDTRRLQKMLEGEQGKPFEDRFKTLRGVVGF